MASGGTAEGEDEQSNEAATKSKSNKKATVISPPLPREPKGPKPEVDDSDDPDFWVPPVGSHWDDDDGKDRWESSPGKDDVADNEGVPVKGYFVKSYCCSVTPDSIRFKMLVDLCFLGVSGIFCRLRI